MLWPVSIHIRMNAPMAMRYQPNDLKPYLERKLTNHFMASKATMKATTQPMRSIIRFSDVAHPVPTASLPTKSSSTSSPVAAAMVGTARKKENSAALRLQQLPQGGAAVVFGKQYGEHGVSPPRCFVIPSR